MKEERAITLITLAVTIIVLIILAGVSLNATIGDNGIISVAQKAKENMELAKVEEEKGLNSLYEELAKGEEGIFDDTTEDVIEKLENFKKIVATAITNEGVVTLETDTAETMAKNISKILIERTKDATATANNISNGMTAWVNGQKITGNGTDVNNSYNNGYNAGKQESIANIYVKEMNMGSGGARQCHIIYDITNANVTSISFQTRRGGGQSRNPILYYSENGTNFTQIAELKGGGAYEYVDRTFDIPSNYNFVKITWEIDNDRAWFHNIKFQ